MISVLEFMGCLYTKAQPVPERSIASVGAKPFSEGAANGSSGACRYTDIPYQVRHKVHVLNSARG